MPSVNVLIVLVTVGLFLFACALTYGLAALGARAADDLPRFDPPREAVRRRGPWFWRSAA